jgi:arsenite-transporting ATPase
MQTLLSVAPRFLLFTGKGGVGKTSLACATATALADRGKRVLLVSTDPASNLDEVLRTPLASTPTPVLQIPNLHALNIDPEAAAHAYRERIVGPYRGVLPEATVRSIEEQLSGACTVEIASFNEFTAIMGNPDAGVNYDHVVLDTAPTGHTLRLLSLPAAWNDFIVQNQSGSSCLGPLSGLKEQRQTYERAVQALTDPAQSLVVLVSRAERSALKEAARASAELQALGVRNQRLILNGIFHATRRDDPTALAFENAGKAALEAIPASLRALPQTHIGFHPQGVGGAAALRALVAPTSESIASAPTEALLPSPETETLESLIDELAAQSRGVVMTMGKGGVGKTTLAARIALALAQRGCRVHLSTTDPAAHVHDAVAEPHPALQVSRIDPEAEIEAYIARVMAEAGAQLDPAGRALLLEELRSPCTQEIAVFQAFAHLVAQGSDRWVVLDTAPTGHTLLLLDATEAYHREVLRSTSAIPEEVRALLPRLRDPDFTKVILVALPEATPVHEAAQLQADLQRAGIAPYAWVVNQSFALTASLDPALQCKAAQEQPYLREVAEKHARRAIVLPWSPSL